MTSFKLVKWTMFIEQKIEHGKFKKKADAELKR